MLQPQQPGESSSYIKQFHRRLLRSTARWLHNRWPLWIVSLANSHENHQVARASHVNLFHPSTTMYVCRSLGAVSVAQRRLHEPIALCPWSRLSLSLPPARPTTADLGSHTEQHYLRYWQSFRLQQLEQGNTIPSHRQHSRLKFLLMSKRKTRGKGVGGTAGVGDTWFAR